MQSAEPLPSRALLHCITGNGVAGSSLLQDTLLQNQCDCRRGDGQIGKGTASIGQARQTVEVKGSKMEARQ